MKERMKIRYPQDCVSLLRRYRRMKQEHFGAIFLNAKKEVIRTKCFFVGSDNICCVYAKIIWWKACIDYLGVETDYLFEIVGY